MIMLTILAILVLCLDNLKQYQTVGDKIFDQVINELILVLRGDSVSKNLPRLNNFFISHNKKRNLRIPGQGGTDPDQRGRPSGQRIGQISPYTHCLSTEEGETGLSFRTALSLLRLVSL